MKMLRKLLGKNDDEPQERRAPRLIAIASGKGGVGKSTITANLAVALNRKGLAVGVLDADIYGPTQPRLFGMDLCEAQPMPARAHGIEIASMALTGGSGGPVVVRAPIATGMLGQMLTALDWSTVDRLLIDLPPGTGDIQLSLAQQAKLDGVIVVSTPQGVAVDIAAKAMDMMRRLQVPVLGLVENMSGLSCESCGHLNPIFDAGGVAALAEAEGLPLLAAIPLDAALMRSGEIGRPVALEDGPASALAFAELADAVEARLAVLDEMSASGRPLGMRLQPDGGLRIDWADGHVGLFSPLDLRRGCQCAACIDELTGAPRLDPSSIGADLAILDVAAVGNYALSIRFSDQHDSGIFTFERLREELCQCPACERQRASGFAV